MKVTVCIGSSCHLKGSRQVVETLRALVDQHNLAGNVELGGTFCMANCQKGVCVTVNEVCHSVSPETAEEFFNQHILNKC